MLKLKSATPTAIATAMVVSAVAVDVLLSACGGASPTQPTFSEERVTVTITENGVSPSSS